MSEDHNAFIFSVSPRSVAVWEDLSGLIEMDVRSN